MPPMICFVAPSGTGKSTAVTRLLSELQTRGFRVGVIKHDAHRLTYDKPGKDTWKFREAGAARAVIAGEYALAMFSEPLPDPSPQAIAQELLSDMDLVLVEGYRTAGLPCIRVCRQGGPDDTDWQPPDNVVAWLTDTPVEDGLPQLPLEDSKVLADFVVGHMGLTPR